MTTGTPGSSDHRRLGVVGTLVWDTIHGRDATRDAPVEEWGGIAYALSAFEAAGPRGWTLVPIIKVGKDMQGRARELLDGLERVGSLEGVRFVDEPNNRVELRYRDAGERTERLSGGVPGWSREELVPLAASCDALYVNFIAGWEMDLPVARRLRDVVGGPVYADLHSLFLDVGPGGVRRSRRLDEGAEWVSCFDFVQVNEDELGLLAGPGTDPWETARQLVADGRTRAVLVTLGDRGARWAATPELAEAGGGGSGGVVDGEEPVSESVDDPDPTGCGDVWGITCFGSLLSGDPVHGAVRRANRLAARNARRRGGRAVAETGDAGRTLETGEGT
ncbi:MAG: PfkB family carbohydrate kinase [Candidatus Palauibacterales bacterium]|nr:PfkB family carbohydrate kinase [Candidatus Palauibacterales bacterium]